MSFVSDNSANYSPLYKQQCQNVKLIDAAYSSIESKIKESIRTEKRDEEIVFTRLLSNITVIWMEASILKICYDNNSFTEEDILEIRNSKSLEQRIIGLINMSVCKKYNIPFTRKHLDLELRYTQRARYKGLIQLIENDFKESVSIRNKIAHGQWKFAYSNNENALDKEITGKINSENIVAIQLKRNLFKNLMDLIQHIVVDFEKYDLNFDIMYEKIEGYKHNKEGRSYQEYRNMLIEKYRIGLIKKNKNLSQSLV
ncbi:hypothetical protein [Bacillus pacificus]|uniref:hypothetical protein n=1 Tax=Bacillus pacificus TaxID=2026187 RepID=UPI00178C3BF8|nr:hypothetical protein [Bacillus pacificus]